MSRAYTFSELSLFQACPRKYRYKYEEMIDVVFEGMPRPIGRAIHKGVEKLHLGESVEVAKHEALAEFVEALGEHALSEDAEIQKKMEDGKQQVIRCVEHYPFAGQGEVVATEAILEADVGGERCYKGRVDLITQVGAVRYVSDTKTTGFQLEPIIKSYRLSKQLPGYKFLANKHGHEVDGCMVDIIKKPRVYHRKKDDGWTISGDEYHREPVTITEKDEDAFLGWFHNLVDSIEGQQKRQEESGGADAFPMNSGQCFSFNRLCPYYEMCRFPERAEMLVDGKNFVRRTKLHPEYDDGKEEGREVGV